MLLKWILFVQKAIDSKSIHSAINFKLIKLLDRFTEKGLNFTYNINRLY